MRDCTLLATPRRDTTPHNMTSRIPPLLQPYIGVPSSGSLTLLTSVLGASANWLIIRYICAALSSNDKSQKNKFHAAHQIEEQGTVETDDVAVVLVSWLRDWEFWKTEARRAGVSCYSKDYKCTP